MINIDKIISVGNKDNLFKLVSSKTNGLILEDLTNGKTNFYSTRSYSFSPLESIGIYTMSDNLPLQEVYKRFLDQKTNLAIPDVNSTDDDLKSYFEKTIPEYDHYRVRTRDMRKCINWFHQLKALGFISFNEDSENHNKA